MKDPPLDVGNDLPGIGLVPTPVQRPRCQAELDDEVARKVLGLDLAPFFPPEADEGGLVVAHDDPGVGAADEVAARGGSVRGGSCDPPSHPLDGVLESADHIGREVGK